MVGWQVADVFGLLFSNNQNDDEGLREMMNSTDHPGAGGRRERQEAGRRGLEGMVIDGEETRRRNDGVYSSAPCRYHYGGGGS